jgi:hypothetical protein
MNANGISWQTKLYSDVLPKKRGCFMGGRDEVTFYVNTTYANVTSKHPDRWGGGGGVWLVGIKTRR